MVSNDLQTDELSEILKSCRQLSNILDLDELYSVFADVVKKKFAIRELAIFVYRQTEKKLSLVFSKGLGGLNCQIQKSKSGLWKSILKGEPFAVSDDAGKPFFSKDFQKLNLVGLQSELWVPLGMGDELTGLVTIGSRKNNQPFDDADRYFLQQLSAHAVVCFNTCRLYEKRQKEKEDLHPSECTALPFHSPPERLWHKDS